MLYGSALEKYNTAIGKVITEARISEDGGDGGGSLVLKFEDGSGLEIYDAGQSCCEHRYLTCDDAPQDLVGKPFSGYDIKDADEEDDGSYNIHETAFVEVRAGFDSITLTTHNEHNGYYGGFSLSVK
jgi:hypothetical protein